MLLKPAVVLHIDTKCAIHGLNTVQTKRLPYQNTFFQVHFLKLVTVLARKTTAGFQVEIKNRDKNGDKKINPENK